MTRTEEARVKSVWEFEKKKHRTHIRRRAKKWLDEFEDDDRMRKYLI